MDKPILFCLPYAGGNKYSFRPYYAYMPPHMEMLTVEYPGRGLRADEDPALTVEQLAEDAYQQIATRAAKGSYALYGHSMGGLVTSLVARKLIDAGLPSPMHIFISGGAAPASRDKIKDQWHLMDKEEFIGKIRELKGAPEEIWSNPDLVDYIEPVLRADFTCYENYLYRQVEPLQVPFTVITGTLEDFEPYEIELWQEESAIPVRFIQLSGDHFFIYPHAREIMNTIVNTMQKAGQSAR